MRLAILITIALLLQACSKTEYVKIPCEPFNFKSTQQPKERTIRVLSDDLDLYDAYINNFRGIIDFHNIQIKDYKNSFKKDGIIQ